MTIERRAGVTRGASRLGTGGVSLLLAGLAGSGCGASEAAPPSAPFATPAQFEAAAAEALCAQISRCLVSLGDEFVSLSNLLNPTVCARIVAADLASPEIAAGLTRGVIRYDAAAGQRCVARLRATCPVGEDFRLRGCGDVYVGSLPVDAACTASAECRPGNWCERTAGCQGACRPMGVLGAPCRGPGAPVVCASPTDGWSVCAAPDGAGADEVCMHHRPGAPAAEGTPCGILPGPSAHERLATPCASGLVCTASRRSGVCRRPDAVDTPCSNDSLSCERGSVCARGAAGNTCQRLTVRTRAGEPCGARMLAICDPAALVCSDDNVGVCVAPGAANEGAPCAPGDFGSVACTTGLTCSAVSSTCVRPGADGQPCSRGDDCASRQCDTTGRCVPACA